MVQEKEVERKEGKFRKHVRRRAGCEINVPLIHLIIHHIY